jgi:hypothetical protein
VSTSALGLVVVDVRHELPVELDELGLMAMTWRRLA